MALPAGPLASNLADQVDEIDATIRQIRMSIFGLHVTESGSTGVRSQILEVLHTAAVLLPGPPDVSFRGPIDLLVSGRLADDVVAVVREGIANVGRHAAARHVQLLVSADADAVTVELLDDGTGLVDDVTLSGLANLNARAEDRGGAMELSARAGGGARLYWTAPL
jgi:signal transduction histidine kinase